MTVDRWLIAFAIGVLAGLALWWLRRPPRESEWDCVLRLLADGRWWSGRELRQASDGRLRRGTMYVLLDRMEDAGEISSRMLQSTDWPTPSSTQIRAYRMTGARAPPGLDVLVAMASMGSQETRR